jgi:hypothetical protein
MWERVCGSEQQPCFLGTWHQKLAVLAVEDIVFPVLNYSGIHAAHLRLQRSRKLQRLIRHRVLLFDGFLKVDLERVDLNELLTSFVCCSVANTPHTS